MSKRKECITLGSGTLMCKEYDGKIPGYSDFKDEDILGWIQGGAELTYTPTFYDASDDTGSKTKTIITQEEAILKSGIVTWNVNTLQKISATARVEEDSAKGVRTIKIGGTGNYDRKSYAICFHHEDAQDGDLWVIVRGVNQSGFTLSFKKDKETVIDAEFKCLPQDDDGTLITVIEQTA